ncbi:MAG: nucleotidyltransferase family protein [Armatimonadota bacterium]
MKPPIELDEGLIAPFCRRNSIVRLWLFGSVLREDFGPESDVDILVEFEPEAVITLLDMARIEDELAHIVGRKVDLRTPDELSRYFRDKVLASAVLQYAA